MDMVLSDIIAVVEPSTQEVEKEIEGSIRSDIPLVYEISKYILGSGGKRIRPCVLLLSSGACGLENSGNRIKSAAAIELIHTASLLHDDVVDRANLRRGNPSANVVWGNQASVLVGDFLISRALNLINSCGNMELINSVTLAAAKLAEGQVLEVMSARDLIEVTEKVCFDIIENKTASLLESCGQIGALLAGASSEIVSALGNYGLNLGIEFQITDDALDYSADQEEFGKGVGQDLMEGKMTLPLLYSLQSASESAKERTLEILDKDDIGSGDISFVLQLVNSNGGVEKSLRVASEFGEKAKGEISSLPPSTYKDSLIGLADFVKERSM